MRTIRSLVAAFIATVALGAVVPPASAGSTAGARPQQEDPAKGLGIRLTEAPVSAADDPRAKVYIVDHLAPGTVIERKIEVSNQTAEASHVVLYPAAASLEKGSFAAAEGDTPNELSTWTTISPAEADIPANGTVLATVTITVPADAAPGETYGVVWAQAQAGATGSVSQVTRVGIRLYLSVGPGGAPAPDFTIESLTARRSSDGKPVVSASVKNTGGRALDMTGELRLSAGPGGLEAGPFPADLGTTLAIGGTQPVSVALDERLPAGPWDASITLRSGLTERTVDATLTFPASGAGRPVDTRAADTPAPNRSGLVLMLLVITVMVIVLWTLLVSRRRRRRRPSAVPLAVSPGGDVDQLLGAPRPRRAAPTVPSRGRHARSGRS
jgi:hypothetical protein